jgi:hypothetical protein
MWNFLVSNDPHTSIFYLPTILNVPRSFVGWFPFPSLFTLFVYDLFSRPVFDMNRSV